jgi:hypothetical protein
MGTKFSTEVFSGPSWWIILIATITIALIIDIYRGRK